MTDRSSLPQVRNPVLALPASQRIRALSSDVRVPLSDLFMEMANDAAERAQTCWRRHKAPMAVYWKAVSVYARHIARVLRRPAP